MPCWFSSGLLRAGKNFEIGEGLLLIYASSALRTLNDMNTIFPLFLPRLPQMLLLWLLPRGRGRGGGEGNTLKGVWVEVCRQGFQEALVPGVRIVECSSK